MHTLPGKTAYLDGIRGVAALGVFLHHFLLAFYPASYTADMAATHAHGLDVHLGRSFLSVFTNGKFCVQLFFVLSGYVLSRSYYQSIDIHTPVFAFYRRYARLYIPVAFSLILVYVLIKCGALYYGQVARIAHSE